VKLLIDWGKNSVRYGLNRVHVVNFFILGFLSSVSEIIGLSIFVPIFQFIESSKSIEQHESNEILSTILSLYGEIGVEPSLETLLFTAFALFFISKTIIFFTKMYHISKYNDLLILLRKKIFSTYINTTIEYRDSVSIGSIVNIIANESRSAVNAVITPIKFMILVISIIISMVVLMLISYQLTLITLILVLFLFTAPMRWVNAISEVSSKVTRKNSEFTAFVVNRLNSINLIKYSGTENLEYYRFRKIAKEHKFYLKLIQVLKARSDYVLDPLLLGASLILIYISRSYYSLDVEYIILFMLILVRIIPLNKELLTQIQALNRMMGPTQSVNTLLDDIVNNYENDNGLKKIENFSDKMCITSVDYSFPNSIRRTLKNITFSIKKKEMVAIVGPSGSGKSTLVDLMTRMRVPSAGEVNIDGVSMQDYTLSSIREIISFAPQEPNFFSSTVREHINYGNSDARESNTTDAATLSGASDFIDSMDKGYDTFIGKDSVILSGGQKKRLDLARSVNGVPDILILDEPEEGLDSNTAGMLYKTLSKINNEAEITVVVVTHDHRFIHNFDKIIVINNGFVESVGTHSELLEIDGWYKNSNKTRND
jgi:ABC-type multidrug transport system fused ATPase/permease subunit